MWGKAQPSPASQHLPKNFPQDVIACYWFFKGFVTLLFVPKGFAHGFICLSEVVRVNYQVDNYYSSENEFGINPFDKDLKINWILEKNQIILNSKDKSYKNLSELPEYKF